MIENKKIVKIKDILRIILLLITIFLSIKSCSYAFSYSDLIDFCGNISNSMTTNTNTIWQANRIVANAELYETLITNLGENPSDYLNYVCVKEYNANSNYLFISKNDINIEFNKKISGTTYPIYLSGLNGALRININNNTIQRFTINIIYGQNIVLGLIENQTSFGTISNCYFKNQWIYSNILSTDLQGKSPYYFADGRVGIQLWNEEYTWYIVQNENFIPLETITEDINYGKLSGLLLTDEILKQLNTSDDCYLYYGDLTTKRYKSNTFTLNYQLTPEKIPSGTITNQSGDVTGSIDLNGIETQLGNINENIISGDIKIENAIKDLESGEQTRDNFWKNTYNSLFTLDSGDIEDLKRHIEDNMEDIITYTEYSEELEILNKIQNTEPTDFIISWNQVDYLGKKLIPSGDINFNNIVKEFKLERLHTLIQVITTFALIILMYVHFRRTLFIALGIGTELYDAGEEENRIVTTQNQTIDLNTGIIRDTRTTRKGRNSTTIVKRGTWK